MKTKKRKEKLPGLNFFIDLLITQEVRDIELFITLVPKVV